MALLPVLCETSSQGYLLSVRGEPADVVETVDIMQSTCGSRWEVDGLDGFAYCIIDKWNLREAHREVLGDGLKWTGITPGEDSLGGYVAELSADDDEEAGC